MAASLTSCSELFPERLIKGRWVETQWRYEEDEVHAFFEYNMDNVVKHRAEVWVFKKEEREVIFFKEGAPFDSAKYQIKGRGHVLKLMYYDGRDERFDIKELNSKEMELHYDIGMETKGVARLSFKKE